MKLEAQDFASPGRLQAQIKVLHLVDCRHNERASCPGMEADGKEQHVWCLICRGLKTWKDIRTLESHLRLYGACKEAVLSKKRKRAEEQFGKTLHTPHT